MSYRNKIINCHITLFNYIAVLLFGLEGAIQFPFGKTRMVINFYYLYL